MVSLSLHRVTGNKETSLSLVVTRSLVNRYNPDLPPYAAGKRSCSGGAAAAESLSIAGSDAAFGAGGGNNGALFVVVGVNLNL